MNNLCAVGEPRAYRKQVVACIALATFVLVANAVLHNYTRRAWQRLDSNASRLKPGMTPNQVSSVMGLPSYQSKFTRKGRELYYYKSFDPLGTNQAEITLTFDLGKLVDVDRFPDQEIPFDSDDWKAASERRRGCMVSSLTKNYSLLGMSQTGLVSLLGKGELVQRNGEKILTYRIGRFRSHIYENLSLVFYVQEQNDKVRSFQVEVLSS